MYIDFLCHLCAMIVLLGTPVLVIGGIIALFHRAPPRHAMRDWRDNARGARR